MTNEIELTRLWHQIATAAPRNYLPGTKTGLITDERAQPGYLGSSFDTGKLLFVGMSPGSESRGTDNDAVHEAIRNFSEQNNQETFQQLNTVLRDQISSEEHPWSIWKYIKPVLLGAGYSLDEFALINLCPWRCDKKTAASLYEECWGSFVEKQLSLLSPRNIVALGTEKSKGGTGYFLQEKLGWRRPLSFITRSTNDRDFHDYEKPYEDIQKVIDRIKRPVRETASVQPTENAEP